MQITPSECFISAKVARPEQPEAFAGVHQAPGENGRGCVLLIADEASGVHEKTFEVGAGLCPGNCTNFADIQPHEIFRYVLRQSHEP